MKGRQARRVLDIFDMKKEKSRPALLYLVLNEFASKHKAIYIKSLKVRSSTPVQFFLFLGNCEGKAGRV